MSQHAASSVMREEVVCRHCHREHTGDCRRKRTRKKVVEVREEKLQKMSGDGGDCSIFSEPSKTSKRVHEEYRSMTKKSNRKLVGTSKSFKKKKYDSVKLKETPC